MTSSKGLMRVIIIELITMIIVVVVVVVMISQPGRFHQLTY